MVTLTLCRKQLDEKLQQTEANRRSQLSEFKANLDYIGSRRPPARTI